MEPFNGLDPEATRTVRVALVRLNQERGVTMIISSHVLEQLNRVATCYGVIASGHMVKEFSEEELHEECGRSIRVRTTDSARTLALLEGRLPDAFFRHNPMEVCLLRVQGLRLRGSVRFCTILIKPYLNFQVLSKISRITL